MASLLISCLLLNRTPVSSAINHGGGVSHWSLPFHNWPALPVPTFAEDSLARARYNVGYGCVNSFRFSIWRMLFALLVHEDLSLAFDYYIEDSVLASTLAFAFSILFSMISSISNVNGCEERVPFWEEQDMSLFNIILSLSHPISMKVSSFY